VYGKFFYGKGEAAPITNIHANVLAMLCIVDVKVHI